MTTSALFMWPRPRLPSWLDMTARHASAERIEAQLDRLFPAAHAVLFSSARAGLARTLQLLALRRPDLLWVPPFSSHCVFEAVALSCTPTTLQAGAEAAAAALVYHQWGHVHREAFASGVPIIEDAVDTLLVPGTSPFATRANFALWSLPKVLATYGGGVVFCRRASDAEALRGLRAARRSSWRQARLRHRAARDPLASAWWNGAEAQQGGLVAPLRGQVLRQLEALPALVDDRCAVLQALFPEQARGFVASGRLPSNVPLKVPVSWERLWGGGAPIATGLRMFGPQRCCPGDALVRVAPLPVHADVSEAELRGLLRVLAPEAGQDELEVV
jgi:putative PLP-dependent aminotransferase (TIGR04422 family)